MCAVLARQVRARNAQKWASVPLYVEYLIANYHYARPIAACFDIDDTMIDGRTQLLMENCLGALHKLMDVGCAVFIVTARSENMRVETRGELANLGVTPDLYSRLLMRDSHDKSHASAKLAERWRIRDTHDLVLAIGDRPHDLIAVDEDEDVPHLNIMMEALEQY